MCVGVLVASAGAKTDSHSDGAVTSQERVVYHDGKIVKLDFVSGSSIFKVGPWKISTQVVHERPRDGHPNLYIVAPGTQYVDTVTERYDHNEIISYVPTKLGAQDWDVYFAIILDPNLHENFYSEHRLIVATQDDFAPAADFKFEDIPGASFLREYLNIRSIEELGYYKRLNGRFPRLIIVPAKLSLKASVPDSDNAPLPTGKGVAPVVRSSALPQH